MALADRLGIGHPQLAEVIEGGPLDAPIADAKLHKTDRRDYAPEFPLERALKDADLALRTADGADLPLLAALPNRQIAVCKPSASCPLEKTEPIPRLSSLRPTNSPKTAVPFPLAKVARSNRLSSRRSRILRAFSIESATSCRDSLRSDFEICTDATGVLTPTVLRFSDLDRIPRSSIACRIRLSDQ
jgi:hypothetical protein